MSTNPHLPPRPIVFFDGECGMCSRFVRWTLRRDRHHRVYFAPLQGSTAQSLLTPELTQSLSTVVFRDALGNLHLKSDAVAALLKEIGFPWSLVGNLMKGVPRFVRDWIYSEVALRRKRLGGDTVCEPLPADTSSRLLG